MKNRQLWFDKPARSYIWEEALPLGNGTLGAMIFGGVDEELIQLNHESVWFGGARERINPSALKELPKVRELLFEGKLQEAEKLTYSALYATPFSQGHYEPLADLKIIYNTVIPHYSENGDERTQDYGSYRRELSLNEAIHSVRYEHDGAIYLRESFISHKNNVMVIYLKADTSYSDKKMNLRFELSRGDYSESVTTSSGDSIVLKGSSGGGGSRFVTSIKVATHNGTLSELGSYLALSDATEAVIYVTGATDFEGTEPFAACIKILETATQLGYIKLKEEHIHDYQGIYNKTEISISQDEDFEYLPINERRKRVQEGADDEGLYELYFNYGRYLLLGCSRPGSLPANLQGIWNKEMAPPWGSKYTININTQMNYWHAETTNLAQCHEALFEHLKRMLPRGKKVAKEMYGCRGFVAHHNTDIYGDCAPQDQWMPATIWPMGGAWLTIHVLEHYAFSKDMGFLKNYYEVIREASLFFIDYLIVDEKGYLVTSPSTSPENTYLLSNNEKSALCYGPSMDTQILRQLWHGFLETSKVLGIEDDMTKTVASMLPRLPETKIGSRGQIMEWIKEHKEWELGHRHISHLYALHPGNEITEDKTPELFKAARVTLEERLANGGGHTGWSRAWIINMWARLHDGEKAHENIKKLLSYSTADNLFDMHPPFQIDGNFGGTAGIAEMLVQSHEGFVRLLPALPKAWKNGEIKGIRVRGALQLDMKWQNEKIVQADFIALEPTILKVLWQDGIAEKEMTQGEIHQLIM